MGKNTKKDKTRKEQSESQEEHSSLDDINEDNAFEDALDQKYQNINQEQLLAQILQLVKETKDGEQLSWAAMYSLKQQQIAIDNQMKEEIQKIKDKYELLKQPIYKQVSAVSFGVRVNEALYKPEGLLVKADLKKVAPQRISDFWEVILDKEGLLSQKIDIESFKKIQEFNCQILQQEINHIRINFKFNSQTDYFTNKQLTLQIKENGDGEPIRIIKEQIKYKKQRLQDSIFTLLFDSKTDTKECYNVASEIYLNYSNALLSYFRQQETDNQQSQQKKEGSDDQDSEEVQPVKKTKPNLEKPDCKQQ